MGWMNDTLEYFKKDPVYRQYHQDNITFSLAYAFTENFMLPLSHDEVVHGKGALIDRMPGDEWQKFANLRLMFGYMFTHPGTKLLFMGNEIGQTTEWKHDTSIQWWLLDHAPHQGMKKLMTDLNRLYRNEPALYEKSFEASGFEWIDLSDCQNSVIIFLRKGSAGKDNLMVVCNFTPNTHDNYNVGIYQSSEWEEILNTDDQKYNGSGYTNQGRLKVEKTAYHGRDHSLSIKVPPLGVAIFKQVVSQKKASKKSK